MSNDPDTLYQLGKLRQADLQLAADVERLSRQLPRHASPFTSVRLPSVVESATALLRRPFPPRLAA
jgi:hypothetical protein